MTKRLGYGATLSCMDREGVKITIPPLCIAPVFENSPGEIFDIWFPNLFNAGCVLG